MYNLYLIFEITLYKEKLSRKDEVQQSFRMNNEFRKTSYENSLYVSIINGIHDLGYNANGNWRWKKEKRKSKLEDIIVKGLPLKIKSTMDKRANNNSANSAVKTTEVLFYLI